VPTSQSIVAGLAPADLRGAYMGAFGSTAAVGFALAPFFGLQVGERYGDTAMWGMFAGVAVVGAVLGAIACRGTSRAMRPSAVLDT
jgi:MFS family permease